MALLDLQGMDDSGGADTMPAIVPRSDLSTVLCGAISCLSLLNCGGW